MLACLLLLSLWMEAQTLQQYTSHPDSTFFKSDEAKRVGDQLLLWQRNTGGWPKNVDMVMPMTDSLRIEVEKQKLRRNDSTTDNGATSQQMQYLAFLYRYTKEHRYQEAFVKGVEYLLAGQYSNGGWPQFWPEKKGYQWHITYNDDAMINTLTLLRNIALERFPYDDELTSGALRARLNNAIEKGINCILNTQIVVDGKPTIWCQQHDHQMLLPAPARAYELPSFCPVESALIVRFLMELPNPTAAIRKSVTCAMEWLEEHKLKGIRVEQFINDEGKRDVRVVEDPNAPAIWARFYDLDRAEPFFCDRDGIPKLHLSEIGYERRTGYSWYNARPAQLFPLYEKWKKTNNVR